MKEDLYAVVGEDGIIFDVSGSLAIYREQRKAFDKRDAMRKYFPKEVYEVMPIVEIVMGEAL